MAKNSFGEITVIKRRHFLQRILTFSTISLLSKTLSCSKKNSSPGIGYLVSLSRILKKILTKEPRSFCEASNLFATTLISRNRCFIYTTHPSVTEYILDSSQGLPRVFIPLRSIAMAETFRAGDALLTTYPEEIPETAKKKGAYIVGLTSPPVIDDYEYDKNAPGRFTEKKVLGTISDMLIHTYLPIWDGLVEHPEYPFGILPGSGPVLCTVITALAGEIYERSGGIGRTGNSTCEVTFSFINTVIQRIARLCSNRNILQDAGTLAAEKIRSGGRLWVYDRKDAMRGELAGGAGVPVFARAISKDGITDGTFQAGDVLIVAAQKSNTQDDLSVIWKAGKITDAIISLCPHDETGGYRIFKETSVSLDNFSYEKDGIHTFDNGTRTFMHTGSIINAILLWAVLGETSDNLIKAGEIPYFLMGTHLAGSDSYNADILDRAGKRGY